MTPFRLAFALLAARAGAIRPKPAPTPRGAAKGEFEFGKETVQGAANDKDMMDEAFKAAGWTVRQAAAQTHTDQAHSAAHGRGRTRQGTPATDPSKVDEVRSPGLNRNFGEVDRDEFRKPYSPGRRKK